MKDEIGSEHRPATVQLTAKRYKAALLVGNLLMFASLVLMSYFFYVVIITQTVEPQPYTDFLSFIWDELLLRTAAILGVIGMLILMATRFLIWWHHE